MGVMLLIYSQRLQKPVQKPIMFQTHMKYCDGGFQLLIDQ